MLTSHISFRFFQNWDLRFPLRQLTKIAEFNTFPVIRALQKLKGIAKVKITISILASFKSGKISFNAFVNSFLEFNQPFIEARLNPSLLPSSQYLKNLKQYKAEDLSSKIAFLIKSILTTLLNPNSLANVFIG